MDVGLLLIATTRTGDLAAIARRTEAIGFESLWIPEHPVIPIEISTRFPFATALPEHYGRWLVPFVALTVAACATTRLRLVTGICLLPEREPLVTAEDRREPRSVLGGPRRPRRRRRLAARGDRGHGHALPRAVAAPPRDG